MPMPIAPVSGSTIGGQRLEQAVEVVDAVADPAEEAVAQQVVHLVDVELARDDLGEEAALRRHPSGEQLGDLGGRDALAVAVEDGRDLVGREQPARHLLVVDAQLEAVLRRMAVGGVAEVVEQRGGAHQPPQPRPFVRRDQAGALVDQRVEHPAGEMHGAQHVREAAVLGAGVDQEGQAELVDPAQALERTAADERGLERVGVDEAVDRVAQPQLGHRRSVIGGRGDRRRDARGAGSRARARGCAAPRRAKRRARPAARRAASACAAAAGRARPRAG